MNKILNVFKIIIKGVKKSPATKVFLFLIGLFGFIFFLSILPLKVAVIIPTTLFVLLLLLHFYLTGLEE